VGDPAQIRAKRVRKQKNDRRDAEHLLKLMLENNFPRIWVPTPENRDVRQLVLHRHRLVGMRTRVMNQLQAIAMNEGAYGASEGCGLGRDGRNWSRCGCLPGPLGAGKNCSNCWTASTRASIS
jgi:transposase